MRMHTLLGAVGLCAVVVTFFRVVDESAPDHPGSDPATGTSPTEPTPPPAPPPQSPQPPRYGHLILQIEGDIQNLAVTHITPKASGYNPTRLQSRYSIDLFDRNGRQLGTYPLDLAAFDVDPARVGRGVRVEGCEVHDSRIVTIANVPYFAETASIEIRKNGKVLGDLAGAQYTRLVEQGGQR